MNILNRYEFEVLKYFGYDNKGEGYSVRRVSDFLRISNSMVNVSVSSLINQKLLRRVRENLQVTERGMEVLEKYRVNKAIILAAGFGSRMMPATSDKPKPMVEVKGKRIIETMLDALCDADIKDVIIVGGYHREVLDELVQKYPHVKIVENDRYCDENNISSIMRVLDELNDNCYICEADLFVSNPQVIERYQYNTNILGSFAIETDDWCFDMIDGCVANYRKGGKYCYNYYGISFWTRTDCMKLQNDYSYYYVSDNGTELFWEFVPFIEECDKYAVEIRLCNKEDIIEIDNYYELQQLDPERYGNC